MGFCQGLQTIVLCPAECLCQESWEGHILLDSAWKPDLLSFFFHIRFTNGSHSFPISPLSKRQGSWQTDLNPSVSVKWDPPGSKHTLKWLNNSSLKIPLGCLSHATTSLLLNVHLHTLNTLFKDIVAYLKKGVLLKILFFHCTCAFCAFFYVKFCFFCYRIILC